jgi:hypothetical protein
LVCGKAAEDKDYSPLGNAVEDEILRANANYLRQSLIQ